MKKRIVLLIDSIVNLLLGLFLILFPYLYETIGVPESDTNFYPVIMGAVFLGIAIALFIEVLRKEGSPFTGLGLTGAVSINICGGIALIGFLIFGELSLPLRGSAFLWSLALFLVLISTTELIIEVRDRRKER